MPKDFFLRMRLDNLFNSASRPKRVHLVGIGGIGMSGLAKVLHHAGWQVQGSNQGECPMLDQLRQWGIRVFSYHSADHISPLVDCVVVSSAISEHNPEIVSAKELGILICHRSDVLRQILKGYSTVAISGTHGKTTTTSLLGYVLDCAHKDPLVLSGGIMDAWGSNVRLGNGSWAVVEADESDKSHLNFKDLQGVLLTNIEEEHMSNYAGTQDLFRCFEQFLQMPQQFAIACGDDPGIQTVLSRHPQVITYGVSPSCLVQAGHIRCEKEGMIFDVQGPFGHWSDVTVKLWGHHNVLNALGVLTAAWHMGLTSDQIRQGFLSFPGVQRRLTARGFFRDTMIIDDYAHHPTEIKVVLETLALMGHKKILAICQPHRYSRLRDTFHLLIESFTHADRVVLLPVYSAGEEALPGIDASWIVTHLTQRGQRAELCEDTVYTRQALEDIICQDAYDVAVFLGAGNITDLAFQIGQGLKEAS